MYQAIMAPAKVLRARQAAAKLGIALSTINDWQHPKSPRFDPTFPKKIKLTAHSVGYLEHELEAWLQKRVEASRKVA